MSIDAKVTDETNTGLESTLISWTVNYDEFISLNLSSIFILVAVACQKIKNQKKFIKNSDIILVMMIKIIN
jgi:hypothetical protein